MSSLTRGIGGRIPIVGRAADIVIVSGTLLRMAQRRGLISQETASRLGAADSSGGQGVSIGELALAGAAAWRLTSQLRRRRQRRKAS